MTYKSDDYVVYRLEGWETPEELAQTFLGDRKKAWIIEDENRNLELRRGSFVVIPLKEERRGGLWPEGYQVVPILCYHRFSKDGGCPLCVSSGTFEEHMKYLKDHGYRVITLTDLKGFLNYRKRIPERSVVITIDDGYRSFYDIGFPILNKYGFKATLFVYTDFIGRSKEALNWDQVKEIRGAGFEIGSHGLSHDDLTKQRSGEDEHEYLERVEKELKGSKKVIDEKLDQSTDFLAYPFGGTSPKVLLMAERAGYDLGLTVEPGSNPFFADPMTLKRNQIITDDMGDFIANLIVFKRFSLHENNSEK